MSKIKNLTYWDFPDTKLVPDGYDMMSVPELSPNNFLVLIEKVNELVDAYNEEHYDD